MTAFATGQQRCPSLSCECKGLHLLSGLSWSGQQCVLRAREDVEAGDVSARRTVQDRESDGDDGGVGPSHCTHPVTRSRTQRFMSGDVLRRVKACEEDALRRGEQARQAQGQVQGHRAGKWLRRDPDVGRTTAEFSFYAHLKECPFRSWARFLTQLFFIEHVFIFAVAEL